MMMKLRFDIDFASYKAKDIEIYGFYKARLTDYKNYLIFNLSQAKLSGINRELLLISDSLTIVPKFSSDSNLTYKIMNYAICSLKVLTDGSGEYYIGFEPKLRNPFCTNLTFDHLFRIIEFGHERIKPLKLFRHSFIQLYDRALNLFDKQFSWRKESKILP